MVNRYSTIEIWQEVLAQIQFQISPANFATWFKNTEILSKKDDQLIVSVPNNFTKEWLENKYNKTILKILNNLGQNIREIQYAIPSAKLKERSQPISSTEINQLEFQELQVDKKTNLNPSYTFDSFVVGSFNELAHAAAWSVTKKPGLIYNPLFIYGGVGLGKTHLIQAAGNEIVKNFPKKKIKYLSSEKFVSEMVAAIKNHNIENFKSRYQDINVLIVDDVQFMAGKEKTQEEFFHAFNTLYENNNQIILSSDRPPKAIASLEERLRSRFEGGMIADIGFPDLETRIAILKAKAQTRETSFSDEIYQYIASNIKNNIRELEGALNRLVGYQKLNNQSPTLEITRSLLKNLISGPAKFVTVQKIIQAVSEFYDLKVEELLDNCRKKEIVKPRQIAMYILKEDFRYSYPFIGRKFGGKDHTTAIHAYKKISREIQGSEDLEEQIESIRRSIYSK